MNDDHDDPGTNAKSASPRSDELDELASRLLDGDITAADVPDSLRTSVTRRMGAFAQHREELARIEPKTSAGEIDRLIDQALAVHRRQHLMRRPRSFGIAAAAASILVLAGLGLTQLASDEPADLVADGGAALMASDAADTAPPEAKDSSAQVATPSLAMTPDGNAIEFDTEEELRVISESWSVDELMQETARESSIPQCSTETTNRLITTNARYRGQAVEIYLADDGTITVHVRSDCSIAFRLGE